MPNLDEDCGLCESCGHPLNAEEIDNGAEKCADCCEPDPMRLAKGEA